MRTFWVPDIDLRARKLSTTSLARRRVVRAAKLVLMVVVIPVVFALHTRMSLWPGVSTLDSLSVVLTVETVLALVFGWLVPKPVYDRAVRSHARTEAELARVLAHMEGRMDPTLNAGVRILEDAARR